jgi:hypothetical protein
VSLSYWWRKTECTEKTTDLPQVTGKLYHIIVYRLARLVIGISRTVGSAKKFVRITSGIAGGEFTRTLRKVCTCQKLKFFFLLLEYCKIRECYAVANAFTIRNMYSLFLYMKCNSRKINRPTQNMTDEKRDTLTFLSCS